MSKEPIKRTSVVADDPEVQKIMQRFPGVSAARVIEVLAKYGARYFSERSIDDLKDALLCS